MVWFDLNRDYIANNLCENRDRPMTMCGGSCVLTKKLEDVGGEENTPDKPLPLTQDELPTLYFEGLSQKNLDKLASLVKRSESLFFDKLFHTATIFSVFHPPES
ncbi:hypothetical protein FUAX_26060 [Fulvitalea axinellae]|uniref:Uncharacterized protein n=1 Tax=Fulvitalea axinellae TaxID=1182444 RepID=A0AAU9D6N0_9BACT|nr:hypothetical protein FUAX_26060 [Fulvitalea axinellae]